MEWGEAVKYRLKVAALLMSFVAPGFLIWMATDTRRQFESNNWPQTSDTVESTVVKPWQDDKNRVKYFGRVAYSYQVNGKSYMTDLTDLGPGTKRASETAALADVAEFQPGMKVDVFYDPADPSVGIIRKGIPQNQLILLIVLPIVALVSIGATAINIRSWLCSRRHAAQTT